MLKKGFAIKSEVTSNGKIGKREYLNDDETKNFIIAQEMCVSQVNIHRIELGKGQELETLINEESGMLNVCFRHERKVGSPRLPTPSTY